MNNILELHQVCKTFPKQKNMKSAFTLDHESVFITIWRKYCICGKCSSV